MQETRVQSLGPEDPLEKTMATHSSILAWEILWAETPGRLQSQGSKSQTQLSYSATIIYFDSQIVLDSDSRSHHDAPIILWPFSYFFKQDV